MKKYVFKYSKNKIHFDGNNSGNQRTIHYTSLAKPWYGCKIGLRNDFTECF